MDARNDPMHRDTESGTLRRALGELEGALRNGAGSIVLEGRSARDEQLLLSTLWKRPPTGFAPIHVPCRGASAQEIAARILEETRTVPVRDPEAALARMMRTQSIRGAQPVLLLDDLESLTSEALARLRSICDGSRVVVRWIVAGSRRGANTAGLPGPLRVIAIDALPVRERVHWKTESAMTPPKAADSLPRSPASSEPATRPPAAADPAPRPAPARAPERSAAPPPAVEPTLRPIRAGAISPQRSRTARVDPPAPPVRTLPPTRTRRSWRLSTRARNAILAIVFGCAGIVLLVQHGPLFVAWATETTASSAARARDWIGSRAGEAASDASSLAAGTWDSIREAAGGAASSAEHAAEVARGIALAKVREDLPAESVPVEAPAPPAVSAARAPAPAPAKISVGINSDPWSNIAVDGVDYGATPLSVRLAPGRHKVRAAMADGRVVERQIDVAKERNRVVFR